MPVCQKTQIQYFSRRHVRREKSLLSHKRAPLGCAQGNSRSIFSEFRKIQRKLTARSLWRKSPLGLFRQSHKTPPQGGVLPCPGGGLRPAKGVGVPPEPGGREYAFFSFVLTKEKKASKKRKTIGRKSRPVPLITARLLTNGLCA